MVAETDTQFDTEGQIEKYHSKLKELELDRHNYLEECKNITEYILPSKGIYVTDGKKPNEETNRFSKIVDPVGTDSLELLAAGIQGGLSSPSRPWFRLESTDKALMKIENLAIWLNYVENIKYQVLAGSNFYTKIHDFYEDEGAFGTAVMWGEEDFDRVVRFFLLTPGTYCVDFGNDGQPSALYRRFHMRAVNIYNRWKGTCSDEIRNSAKKTPYKWHEVVHVVERNTDRDPNLIDNANMPWREHYFEFAKRERFLESGGYNERPFAVGRWKVNDVENYGTGPGHVALGLVRMLQSIQKTSLRALHKEADPPMRMPSSFKDTVNSLPGGVNYVAENNPRESVGKLFDMHFDYKGTEFKIEKIEQAIQRIFKRDLFLLITDRPEMTATEVVERSQEKLIMIGPVIERQLPDVLDVMLERTFGIMSRRGMIPPPPPELLFSPLKLTYISLLAQAQKMIGLQGMRSLREEAMAISQFKPDSMLKINWDYYLDEYAGSLSLPPQLTVPDEVLQRQRAQQQQLEQMAAELEMLKTGSEAAKNLGVTEGG